MSLESEAADYEATDGATDDPLAALLQATAAGDEEAFAELYLQSSGRLLSVAMRMLRRRDAAEDVLQEAYLQIWRNAAAFEPEKGTATAWLIGIIRYRALDRLRRDGRVAKSISDQAYDDEVNAVAIPAHQAEQAQHKQELSACLDRLESRQQHCIVLAYCDGYTHNELAERFDCPLGTIKSWIRRGVMALKECLDRG